MSDNKRLSIKINDDLNLVVEKNTDNDYKEFFIYLESPEGVCEQDLAIVGCDYEYDDNLGVKIIPDKFLVKVYGDGDNEDYTNEFVIRTRKYARFKNIIITAGALKTPVDAVNSIVSINNSKLAAEVADYFKENSEQWRVIYVHTPEAVMPKNQNIETYEVSTAEELLNKIKTLNDLYSVDVFLHTMSISDYIVKTFKSEDTLCFATSPKNVTKAFRKYMPHTLMIGCNTMDNVEHDVLIDTSYNEVLQKGNFDYVFAEDLELLRNSRFMTCYRGFFINKNKDETIITDDEKLSVFIHKLIEIEVNP